ncbi:uncharacterized protein A4U43_C09F2840 [Asparagus officinalis]|uniref:Flavin-containing monooxygenase n=1 Tax=Asparagus officinalis TaxID=4686 RepID=A0A5P1E848_ASPOF|nr:probable indole-3-pyruvate monooxygenase YUCCA10 [Asparagus officinalis]ONK57667.1 uncharacterized protein A4U43_C09F2840 [Asparagus officinalis]
MKKGVVIVGAGPAGLAIAACLNVLSIPNIHLEKEDCYAHLWKKKAYDRLSLHLAKEFCALPHMPHADSTPTYIPKNQFVEYLDEYVVRFNVNPIFNVSVECAMYDECSKSWSVKTRNLATGEENEYKAQFLVVATGENAQGIIPDIPGLKSFDGDVIHSSRYSNSGMEIAYDLTNFGAKTSISIRSPFHVMTKGFIRLGMTLVQYLPLKLVDKILIALNCIYYGNLSRYGILRPEIGPLALKALKGRSAVIDVGTVNKIKSGEIQVVKEPVMVNGNQVTFKDGETHHFDGIVFATGYRSTAKNWLKDDKGWLLNEDGLPREKFPNHWKGKNGLYCVGLSKRGLFGIAKDAEITAQDIAKTLSTERLNG